MVQYTGKVSEEILAEMTRRLVEEFDPEQIILFGSQALSGLGHAYGRQ